MLLANHAIDGSMARRRLITVELYLHYNSSHSHDI